MKAVLDEGVAHDLADELARLGCVVEKFPAAWKGTKNGRLLNLLEERGFDVLVTNDRNMRWQQTISGRRVGIVVLPTQKLVDLISYLPMISELIGQASPGVVTEVPRRQGRERN